MELGVGKDLFSVCGKCGPEWHVIVSMDGKTVTKVQCKVCMGYHRYRCPPGEQNVNAETTAKRRRVTAPTGRASTRKRTKTTSPDVEPDLTRPVRDYAISDTYVPGDRIEHPKFGQGVVESIPAPGKMDVFFEEGRRTLIHARSMSI